MGTPRLFYKLAEFAEEVEKSEYALIQMAAAGAMALSVWFDGMLLYPDDKGFRFVGFYCGLLVLPPDQALNFTIEDSSRITRLTVRVSCEDIEDSATLEADGVPEPFQNDEFKCVPRLACRAFCGRVDMVDREDKREFFIQVGRDQEYLSSPYPPEVWQLVQDNFPKYKHADLCVSVHEAKRLMAVYFAKKEQVKGEVVGGTEELRNPPGSRLLEGSHLESITSSKCIELRNPKGSEILTRWKQISEYLGVCQKTAKKYGKKGGWLRIDEQKHPITTTYEIDEWRRTAVQKKNK